MLRTTSCAAVIALLSAQPAFAKNFADLTQTGDAQALDVSQNGGKNGSAVIEQSGSNNSIFAKQSDEEIGIGRVSPANILTIKQAGDHNSINDPGLGGFVELFQKNTAPGLAANIMNIQQVGKANAIVYGQKGYDNYADIKQGLAGERGRAASSGNKASLAQLKSHNTATITQDGFSNLTVNEQITSTNLLLMKQGGTRNVNNVQQLQDDTATVDQSGFDNLLVIRQYDALETADVGQSGHDNTLYLTQDQPLDSAKLTQGGSFNDLTVKQVSVGANAIVSQLGTASTISLTQ